MGKSSTNGGKRQYASCNSNHMFDMSLPENGVYSRRITKQIPEHDGVYPMFRHTHIS